jgi:hypothetical protein
VRRFSSIERVKRLGEKDEGSRREYKDKNTLLRPPTFAQCREESCEECKTGEAHRRPIAIRLYRYWNAQFQHHPHSPNSAAAHCQPAHDQHRLIAFVQNAQESYPLANVKIQRLSPRRCLRHGSKYCPLNTRAAIQNECRFQYLALEFLQLIRRQDRFENRH